jgi:hypothetical protein
MQALAGHLVVARAPAAVRCQARQRVRAGAAHARQTRCFSGGALALAACPPRRSSARTATRCSGAAPGGPLGFLAANRAKSRELGAALRSYGLAGVLAYGLLNTLYYTCAFLVVWVYVLKVPAGLGTAAAARRFGETFVVVWAGSQVTKLARAGGALVLAPVANALLDRVQARLPERLRSRGVAFTAAVCACVLVALLLFSGVVLLWS